MALEERAAISRRLLERIEASARPAQLERHRDDIAQAAAHIEVLRAVIDERVRYQLLRREHGSGERNGPDATG